MLLLRSLAALAGMSLAHGGACDGACRGPGECASGSCCNKTYSNACFATAACVSVAHDGTCK